MASIQKRGNTYFIAVSMKSDIYGKRLRETTTFVPEKGLSEKKQRKAAEEYAVLFENRVKNGLVLDGRKTSLKEFTDRWLAEYAAQHLQPRTLESYKAELTVKILPVLGHLNLMDLRPSNLNAFFVSLGKDGARKDGKPGGYSRNSITKTRNVLSAVLRTAAEWELVEHNPLENVRIQAKATAEKLKFFTPEQAATFLNYIEQPYTVKTAGHKRTDDTGKSYTVANYKSKRKIPEQLRVLFILAIYTGLRKGELLALEWQDIDFENNTVSVSKSVSVVAGQQVTKEPKTKNSFRSVAIPRFLTKRIQEMKAARTRYRLSLGDYWQGAEWLFIQDNGKQMSYSTPYSAFRDTIARYNSDKAPADQLPAIPFHGLRHPYVKHTTKIFSLRLMDFQAQAYPDARRKTRGACQLHRGEQS